MALDPETYRRVEKRVEQARRLRRAMKPRPPAGVVLVARLDQLVAGLLAVGMILAMEGVARGPRLVRADAPAFLLVYLMAIGTLILVGRGLMRGSRLALGFHVFLAAYELAVLLFKIASDGLDRVPSGALWPLVVHALILAPLLAAARRGWFRQAERPARLPRAKRRQHARHASMQT